MHPTYIILRRFVLFTGFTFYKGKITNLKYEVLLAIFCVQALLNCYKNWNLEYHISLQKIQGFFLDTVFLLRRAMFMFSV